MLAIVEAVMRAPDPDQELAGVTIESDADLPGAR
jgi:hypothetical protein